MQFENTIKKQNNQNVSKLQKQILSTLKFSKTKYEKLNSKFDHLSNEIAIDISTVKSSIMSEIN